MQTQVLIVGCGDLGTALAHRLNQQHYSVTPLRRSLPQQSAINYIQADVTQPNSLKSISEINPEFVVYCVAASAQTDESYRLQYVEGLRNVLDALKKATYLKHVFFVSSTRVYGQSVTDLNANNFLDETTPAMPADFGGQRLLEAEQLLLNAAKAQQNWQGTVLRLTGIYGPGRTYMLRMAASPQDWPEQNIWTNRIHRDDAAAFIQHLIQMRMNEKNLTEKTVANCYVVTDSNCVSQYEVLQWIAQKTGMKLEISTPPVTGGKRMSNQRMLSTGFSLSYPDYKTGYAALLQSV